MTTTSSSLRTFDVGDEVIIDFETGLDVELGLSQFRLEKPIMHLIGKFVISLDNSLNASR